MLEVLHIVSCSSIGSCRFSMKIDSFEPSLREDDDCFHAHCVTRTGSNSVVQKLWVQKTRHVFSCSSIGSCRFSMKIDSFEPSLRGDDNCFHAHCVTRTGSNAVVQQLWVQKTRHVFSCSSIDSRRFTLKIEPFELSWWEMKIASTLIA